jgi:CspA family cold shock protein
MLKERQRIMWSWFRRLFKRNAPSSSYPPVQGTVKRIIRDRGFGFIRSTDGKEVFFHRSALVGRDMGSLSEGQKVEFVLEESPKGPRASKVRVV